MKRLKAVVWWWWASAAILLSNAGVAEGEARFMHHIPLASHYPHEYEYDETPPHIPHYPDTPHDSDIKLPGRHYPKLPYTVIDPHPNSQAHDTTKGTLDHHLQPQRYPGKASSDYNPYKTDAGNYDQDDKKWTLPDSRRGGGGWGWNGGGGQQGDASDGGSLYQSSSSSQQRDTTGELGQSGTREQPDSNDESPRFDRSQPRSVTVQAGKTATLVCRVLNIGDKSVSWMRQRDLHILTVGKYKYSTDRRVSVDHVDEEWRLRIQSATEDDSGMYECQLSTKPILSFIVSLQVVASPIGDLQPTETFPHLRDEERVRRPSSSQSHEDHNKVPSAVIVNGPAIHVHRGSLINLTCVVEHTPERPIFIVWYHYNKVMDYEEAGGQVVVSQPGSSTVSQLLIPTARPSHSGKYTCRPSTGEDASAVLHVHDGENPAAMQTNGGVRAMVTPGLSTTIPTLLLMLLQSYYLLAHLASDLRDLET